MNTIFQYLLKHGCFFLFGALFAHQIGFPLPGPLFLLAGGALAAAGKMSFFAVVGLTVAACVLADWVWYEAGRLKGHQVLHFMHRFTRDPDFHDRRSKEIFARYGPRIFLIAKFVPGLDAVSPPLAAISRISRVRFLSFDAVGAGLYGSVYGGLGYVFSSDLDRAASCVGRVGTVLAILLVTGLFIYAGSRLVHRNRVLRRSQVVRAAPATQSSAETL